jgi:glycosyltransferase involved in cell wall biosynthesis
MAEANGYTSDPCDDFRQNGRLVDLTNATSSQAIDTISNLCAGQQVKLLLQVGAPQAYRQIPYIKERCRDLRICDVLYNPVGHTTNHFLYENAFNGAIVESQAMRDFVAQNTSLSDKSIYVVESGIDLTDFHPASKQIKEDGSLVLGYVGRMSPEKNPLGFVEMAEQLSGDFSNLKFKIFGEGPQLEEVRARVRSSRVANLIDLQGYVAHVRDAMAQIDCLLVPSKLDGRPNIVMEANACGVPVIGAPVGGIPELITEGVNGYIRSTSDIEGLKGIVAKLSNDKAFLQQIRKTSRATAEINFDRNRMLSDYANLFANLSATS